MLLDRISNVGFGLLDLLPHASRPRSAWLISDVRQNMVIPSLAAKGFIKTYSRVLLDAIGPEAHQLTGEKRTEALVAGRKKLMLKADALGDDSIFSPKDDENVRQAIRRLVYSRWVYLRDTTQYSIVLSPERGESYAVLGLVDGLATVFGGPSVSFEAAICPLDDHFVCDGLFAGVVHIGSNMRADFRALHSSLARKGRFYKHP